MKCEIIIDPEREEHIIICLKEPNAVADKIAALVSEYSNELIGYTDNTAAVLSPDEVYCFFSEDGKIYALCEGNKLQLRLRLIRLEELYKASFVRINQSCLVNVSKIKKIEASFGGALAVVLKNGYRDYISRRQIKTVKERLGVKK
ncbi:MAG: LytTR family transcriptional regulator DNA-binding domain-containing protein [Clostridia bacterium]|nr:LytTR family transcriptional regulator DNA-binding domain-containing protein [Clostridia bacterium]